jgi:hypothetical protein
MTIMGAGLIWVFLADVHIPPERICVFFQKAHNFASLQEPRLGFQSHEPQPVLLTILYKTQQDFHLENVLVTSNLKVNNEWTSMIGLKLGT